MYNDAVAWMIVAVAAISFVMLTWFVIAGFSMNHKIARETELNTTTSLMRAIRRHDGSNTEHSIVIDAETTFVLENIARVDSSHWAISGDNEWHDSQHPVDAPATGRHHNDNPYRVIVPRDWKPAIGQTRIALLSTLTSEYQLIATRRPHAKELVW